LTTVLTKYASKVSQQTLIFSQKHYTNLPARLPHMLSPNHPHSVKNISNPHLQNKNVTDSLLLQVQLFTIINKEPHKEGKRNEMASLI